MEDNLGPKVIRVHRYTGSELVFLRIAESTTPAAIRYLGGCSHFLCLISEIGPSMGVRGDHVNPRSARRDIGGAVVFTLGIIAATRQKYRKTGSDGLSPVSRFQHVSTMT